MNEEEKKAIDILKNSIADYVIGSYCKECIDNKICESLDEDCYFLQAIDTVVNLIEKQEKVIDEMTIYINNNIDVISKDIEGSICCHNKDGKCINRKCVECVKEYFYKEVENK